MMREARKRLEQQHENSLKQQEIDIIHRCEELLGSPKTPDRELWNLSEPELRTRQIAYKDAFNKRGKRSIARRNRPTRSCTFCTLASSRPPARPFAVVHLDRAGDTVTVGLQRLHATAHDIEHLVLRPLRSCQWRAGGSPGRWQRRLPGSGPRRS
jgi:hypothetical protein